MPVYIVYFFGLPLQGHFPAVPAGRLGVKVTIQHPLDLLENCFISAEYAHPFAVK